MPNINSQQNHAEWLQGQQNAAPEMSWHLAQIAAMSPLSESEDEEPHLTSPPSAFPKLEAVPKLEPIDATKPGGGRWLDPNGNSYRYPFKLLWA